MTIFHKLFKQLSSSPRKNCDVDVPEDVTDVWPRITQHEEEVDPVPRAGLGASEDLATDQMPPPADLQDLPGITQDADDLMYEFMQRCVEIAVGEQIKDSALNHAKEKLDAAVAFHELLRDE